MYYMKTGGGTMTRQQDNACTEIILFFLCVREDHPISERGTAPLR